MHVTLSLKVFNRQVKSTVFTICSLESTNQVILTHLQTRKEFGERRQMLRGHSARVFEGIRRRIFSTFYSHSVCVCVCVLQVLAFYSLYEQCEQAVDNSENWLKVQAPPASEPEPLRVQLDRCRVSQTKSFCVQTFSGLSIINSTYGHFLHPLFLSMNIKSICFVFFCILFVRAIFLIFFFTLFICWASLFMHLFVTALFCKYLNVIY